MYALNLLNRPIWEVHDKHTFHLGRHAAKTYFKITVISRKRKKLFNFKVEKMEKKYSKFLHFP